jgi:hypothetical protein
VLNTQYGLASGNDEIVITGAFTDVKTAYPSF